MPAALIENLTRNLTRMPTFSLTAQPVAEMTHALSALCCLTQSLQLLANEDNFHRFTLERYDLGQVRIVCSCCYVGPGCYRVGIHVCLRFCLYVYNA